NQPAADFPDHHSPPTMGQFDPLVAFVKRSTDAFSMGPKTVCHQHSRILHPACCRRLSAS
ncbi:MAG: hypothetical protein ACOYM5_15400, partial [Caulobacter sp.]